MAFHDAVAGWKIKEMAAQTFVNVASAHKWTLDGT